MSRVNVAATQQKLWWGERVLFVDAEALVIDKPAGLAVHAGPRTHESLEDYLGDLRLGFMRPPTIVHRLDRDTSGCLLLARHPKAHKRLQRAFEEGAVTKTYVAILAGLIEAEEGAIDMPLAKVSTREEGWRMVSDPAGKAAVTHWRKLAVMDGRTVILFSPETGRTPSSASTPRPGSARRSSAILSMATGAGRCCSTPCRFAWRGRERRRSRRGRRCRRRSSTPASPMSPEPFVLPEEALEEKFIASTGPGGQNVNKVATAVQLRCDVFKLGLAPHVYAQLKVLAGSRMTESGEIVITARTYRTQEANREEARTRLAELIAKAHIRKAKRIRTRPSRAAKARRVDAKKGRSAVKQARAKPRID